MKNRSTAMLSSSVLEEAPERTETTLERLRTVTHAELQRLESAVALDAVSQSIDDDKPAVRLRCLGRVVMAQPLDTRRLVLSMAAYLSLN
jgi:hypothetical protein